MKKIIALFCIAVLLFSLCACNGEKLTPRERIPDEVKNYISTNYRIKVGTFVSESVNVDIASIVETQTNQWAVLGTYTIKIDKEIMSAKFGLVVSYDEGNDKFTFSKEEFDDFK